ncbi:MAG: sulfatase-like hydrolase/transferase [Prevotella sp.]|nr:sulfatase-like hydrolase/transferase [Prevotella sp.]
MNNNSYSHPTLKAGYASCATAFLINMALAYVLYFICRIAFILSNYGAFSSGWSALSTVDMVHGSLLFDTSAILYTNALYALMMLVPLHRKEHPTWQAVARWLFVLVNSIMAAANLADAAYFKYTGRRTTASVFSEFSNEDNLLQIIGTELLNHWFLVVLWILLVFAVCRLAVSSEELRFYSHGKTNKTYYYLVQALMLLIYVPLCVAGMRGGFTTAVRPITISNANQYVNRPAEAAIVLNTPFSIIRTMGKKTFRNPHYYTQEELDKLYTPVFNAKADTTAQPAVKKRRNVVVLIVESFGREYIGGYNSSLDGGHYKGFAPFADSLLTQSLTFDYTFANGRKSIDGMPSILSGIPHFLEPFFLTAASLNDVSGLADCLGKCGYESAFFHGAQNGSMGFEAFSRTTGYKHYYGRTEFNADKRFRGDNDFDGTWAIWDEPFLQYYALKMSEMREPFVTSVFTASSHSPYNVPEEYSSKFTEEGSNPIHKCIRYTDMALRRFFETAQKQPWYKNTIFVLTSDHTNIPDHKEYMTDLGVFVAPIMIFDPSGELPRGRRSGIAQQTDIMPTVLQYLGYNQPYVAFGCDLLNTPSADTWAVNYSNGTYQYVSGDYVIQFDGAKLTAAYNIKKDWMMQHNMAGDAALKTVLQGMTQKLKAIIQSYMQRMEENKLTPGA